MENALASPTDVATLGRSLATELPQTPSHSTLYPALQPDSDQDLLLLGLILYCFFDTPNDYAIASLRLRQVFHQLYHSKGYGLIDDSSQALSPSQLTSAASIL